MTSHITQAAEASAMLEAKFGSVATKPPGMLISYLRAYGVSALDAVDATSLYTGKRLRLWRWAVGMMA